MTLVVHRWPRNGPALPPQGFEDPREAVAAARSWSRGAPAVIAAPWEAAPRRPTKWELELGRAFATRAARPEARGAVALPATLNSDYAVLPPRRRERRPTPVVVPARRATAPVEARVAVSGALMDLSFRSRPRAGARPDPEVDVVAALETGGGPVFERECGFGRNWSSRRSRVIRDGRMTAYCGYGMWVLLGRDVPVGPKEADAVCQAARGILWLAGSLPLTRVFDALRDRGGVSRRLDTPVYLAALLRRCGDLTLDDRTGLASIS